MADVTQTPADVETGDHSSFQQAQAGEALIAGDFLYVDNDDSGKCKKADAAAATASETTASVAAMALTKAADDDYFAYMPLVDGQVFKPGGTVEVGTTYVVSPTTPGKIAPDTDLDTGDYISVIGVGVSTTDIQVGLNLTGVTHS